MTNKQKHIEEMKAFGRYNKKLSEEKKKITKAHEEYLKRDIIEIYGAMAVVLFENGNDVDKIEELINQIGAEWTHHVNTRDITMAEYCKQLTGIDLLTRVE